MSKILVVDDDRMTLELMREVFQNNSYEVETAINGLEAYNKIKEFEPDIILSDLQMPEMDGMALLENLKEDFADLALVFITADDSIETAVNAMKKGAKDYILKPIRLDEVLKKIGNLAEYQSLKKENEYLRSKLEDKFNFSKIIGKNKKMFEMYNLIKDISETNATVLILGESGTGKELIANAIHFNSDRAKKPFVKVNCAVLSENLLESELFGHIKGSFTGAIRDKIGRFEQADGGTFFLDEIGDISLNMQVKLLRVLQEGEFERVGDLTTRKVNVRIIAATSRNLQEMMKTGEFRQDLYYRLNVIPITVPSLRERRDDIPLLLDHFIKKFSDSFKKEILEISDAAMQLLMNYSWPGNIRELENFIERTVILNKNNEITIDQIPDHVKSKSNDGFDSEDPFQLDYNKSLTDMVDHYEKGLITEALNQYDGNKLKTASALQIHRSTFMSKIKKYEL
jgi:two-component system, NtrC family, response regulator AtoC